jgi:hypothetical protein
VTQPRGSRRAGQAASSEKPTAVSNAASSNVLMQRATTANPRSDAWRTALSDASIAAPTPKTIMPGPSMASGWPQQNTWATQAPAGGTAVNASASFPDTVSYPFAL